MRDVDADQRRHAMGVSSRKPPRHVRTDACAHEMKGSILVAERLGDREDVLRILVEVIVLDALGSSARAEPAQIRRDSAKPHIRHCGNLVVPFPTVARQAVQQHEQRPVFRAVGQGLERHASCGDFKFFHRRSVLPVGAKMSILFIIIVRRAKEGMS